MIILPIILIGIFTPNPSKDMWWTYLSSYPEGPGSITVNLGLKQKSPILEYSNLVVTGVKYEIKNNEKLPALSDIDDLNLLSEKRLRVLEKLTKCILTGTFTYNGERLDYIYVRDTNGIRQALDNFYRQMKIGDKSYINIKEDKKWEAYVDFLFPNKDIIEFYRSELTKIGYFKMFKQK